MANTFLKAERIAAQALGLLQRELVLPRLVTLYGRSDFVGAKNDTVTVRVPARLTAREYEWRTRTAPIVIDDITETSVDVKLDKHPYHAGALTDEQLTLDIADFGVQVLQPQVRAVAIELENILADVIEAVPVPTAQQVDLDMTAGGDPWRAALEARRILNTNNVPMADRVLLLGSNVEVEFLDHDKFVKANEAGTDSALRDAIIGRIAGFTVVTSNAIDPDKAFAFHKTACAFANVAPVVPDGATFGRSQEYQGLAMRWLRDYDPNYLRDRSVVSAFAGASSVNEALGDTEDVDVLLDDPINLRAVKINFTPPT